MYTLPITTSGVMMKNSHAKFYINQYCAKKYAATAASPLGKDGWFPSLSLILQYLKTEGTLVGLLLLVKYLIGRIAPNTKTTNPIHM